MSDHIKWTGGVREKMEGATRILTIENGPLNLLNPRIMRDLRARLSEADADEDVLAILLTGAGDCFCGGLDIAAIQTGADPVEFAKTLVELLDTIPNLGVPLAAAVNGDALASGASLVAACDYAAAADNIRIGTMEVSAGIWPMIAQVPLIHRLGARAAIENVGSGEPFNAERSKEVGLVQRIVPPGAEIDAAREWLDKASRAPHATPVGRRSLYEFASMPYAEALQASLARFVALFN
jgi:enoyl-CoA hydratase/carnithine racemase